MTTTIIVMVKKYCYNVDNAIYNIFIKTAIAAVMSTFITVKDNNHDNNHDRFNKNNNDGLTIHDYHNRNTITITVMNDKLDIIFFKLNPKNWYREAMLVYRLFLPLNHREGST